MILIQETWSEDWGRNGMYSAAPMNHSINSHCSRGLPGVPSTLSNLRDECGLLSPVWDSYGAEWQDFTRKWLLAEGILAKAGKGPMTTKDVKSTGLPKDLQKWAVAMITKTPFDSTTLTDAFGEEMKKWWNKICPTVVAGAEAILLHSWCRIGCTGIIMLVLGMHWWAAKSGRGKAWSKVLKEMTAMFDVLANAPCW
jgi:hypothetical protein